MASYTVGLTDGSSVEVDTAALAFSPDEDILIWRDEDAPWPFIIPRSDWYYYARSANMVNAARNGGSGKRPKRSRVENQLAQYMADIQSGPGPIFGQ